jgi:hypothetical protein
MYENSICAIDLAPVTFWPPAMARRMAGVRQFITLAVTGAITGGSLFGIAVGFAAVSEQDDTLLQSLAHSAAMFTGLIS